MDFDVYVPVPIDDAVRDAVCAPVENLGFGRLSIDAELAVSLGKEYLPSKRPVVDRILVFQEGADGDDVFVRMDEVIARALALIPGELAIVTEYDSVMVDRTAQGEVRYRHKDPYYRPFLLRSLGPV
jgi:hypothetical protein